MPVTNQSLAETIFTVVKNRRSRFLEIARTLVEFETPSDEPDVFEPAFEFLRGEFNRLDFATRRIPGDETAGCLYARPTKSGSTRKRQLLLGHLDTVWSTGTLDERPFELDTEDNRASGPGLFDMKAGLAQLLVALECLEETSQSIPVTPLVLINSDEEIGSPESQRWIKRLAPLTDRTYVLEPAMGPKGLIKTARKGIGHFTITIEGKASHAGISPEKGASAILELSHVIQELNRLNEPEDGITVNVGVIEGGSRSNVVAARSVAEVDVRVVNNEQADDLERAVRNIEPENENITLTVEGGFRRPPMERTDRNRKLWKSVRRKGKKLDLELTETRSGGASDGNTASQYTATVDGLGPVGDGAHEKNEFILVDETLKRTALLALLLLKN